MGRVGEDGVVGVEWIVGQMEQNKRIDSAVIPGNYDLCRGSSIGRAAVL